VSGLELFLVSMVIGLAAAVILLAVVVVDLWRMSGTAFRTITDLYERVRSIQRRNDHEHRRFTAHVDDELPSGIP